MFSLSRIAMIPVVVLALILAWVCLAHAQPVSATTATTGWLWIVVPLVIGALLALAYLSSVCAATMRVRAAAAATDAKERDFDARVARLMDTVGSVASGIAATLLQHPPAPADVIAAVRGAAISQGVQYVQAHHPEDMAAIGLAADTLATRLDNTVSQKLLTGSVPLPNALAAAPVAAAA